MPEWANTYVYGPETGPLRGIMETESELGVSVEGVPPGFMTTAKNVVFTSEGRPKKRPGRNTVSNFTGRTSPAWVGENNGLLYDADAAALKQGATSVSTAFAGNAGIISHTNYVTAAAVSYLIVTDGTTIRKITGTTASAITGILSVPEVVCTAGNRLFCLTDNNLFWSIPNASLATTGEWTTDNTLSMAVRGLQEGTGMIEFGGFLYVFGRGAVVAIDPRDPLGTDQNIILSDFGVVKPRSIVKGKDSIFFTDTTDVYRWSPGGGPPVSIAELGDGKSLVRFTISDVSGSNPYDVMGYDQDKDLVFLSSDTDTLVYDVVKGAWTQWEFGSDSWTVVQGVSYLTETSLTEVLALDGSIYRDVIGGTGTEFEIEVVFAPLRTANDSEVALKNLLLVFPSNDTLTDTTITVGIIQNGQTVVQSRTVEVTDMGTMVWDTDVWADDSVDAEPLWSGGAGMAEARVPFAYPQGRVLQVSFTVTDNNPFLIQSMMAQIQERRRNAA